MEKVIIEKQAVSRNLVNFLKKNGIRFHEKFVTGNCVVCGKEIIKLKENKRYCSPKCNSRYRYKKLRKNPEFKQKQKKNFNRWIKSNRKYYNGLMNEMMTKRYWRLKKLGLCTNCGRKKEFSRRNRIRCIKCANRK